MGQKIVSLCFINLNAIDVKLNMQISMQSYHYTNNLVINTIPKRITWNSILIYLLFPFEKVLSFHMVLMGEDFKVVNLFSLFMYNPLKIEWMWPFIWTNLSWIHFTQGCFVSRLIKIGLVVLEIFFNSSIYIHYFAIISLEIPMAIL